MGRVGQAIDQLPHAASQHQRTLSAVGTRSICAHHSATRRTHKNRHTKPLISSLGPHFGPWHQVPLSSRPATQLGGGMICFWGRGRRLTSWSPKRKTPAWHSLTLTAKGGTRSVSGSKKRRKLGHILFSEIQQHWMARCMLSTARCRRGPMLQPRRGTTWPMPWWRRACRRGADEQAARGPSRRRPHSKNALHEQARPWCWRDSPRFGTARSARGS
jgi:hypothetical protein